MFFNIISMFLTQFVLGFIAWTCWQIAAMYVAIPSIPLIAGLALWVLWFLMLYAPIFSALSVMDRNNPTTLLKKKEVEEKDKDSKLD